jgi:cytochrome c556
MGWLARAMLWVTARRTPGSVGRLLRGAIMKRARIAAALVGIIAVGLGGAAALAAPKEQSLKQLMGENFAGLEQILVSLINSNYAGVAAPVKLIHEHATALTQMVPANAKADRDRFQSYAYELRTHADDLATISQVLVEHDMGKQQLATDSLREAAAAHYGGMVTMCVSCHNRFRPNVAR